MSSISARKRGSLKRFVAWSSKQSGVLQKSFMTDWNSTASSMPRVASSSKLAIKETPLPVGFSCRKSPRQRTKCIRPKRLCSRT